MRKLAPTEFTVLQPRRPRLRRDRSKAETIRRLCFGNLIRLGQHRYGLTLPDDDAGREHLNDLLCLASLAANEPARKMKNAIELQTPWMDAGEAESSIDTVNRMPTSERWRIAKQLGERHRVTNAERERLGLRNISPCDMTKKDLAEQRRSKDRARKARKRIEKGSRDRAAYLASFAGSINKTKPWVPLGISKASYYRQKKQKERKAA